MDDIIGTIFIFVLYGIPLVGVIYTLSRLLIKQNRKVPPTSDANSKRKFINLKNTLLFLGILYSLFVLISLIYMVFRPEWFDPPAWLKFVTIILFVPFIACIYGLYGLGQMGEGGVSPIKVVKDAANTISDEYCTSNKEKSITNGSSGRLAKEE